MINTSPGVLPAYARRLTAMSLLSQRSDLLAAADPPLCVQMSRRRETARVSLGCLCLTWKAVVPMSQQSIEAIVGTALFMVPTVAIIVSTAIVRISRKRNGQPGQRRNGWIIAAAVILLGASIPFATLTIHGTLKYGLSQYSGSNSGISLLLLAGLVLGFTHARAAGLTMVILAIVLPLIVALTGNAWVTNEDPPWTGVFMFNLLVVVTFSLPALVGGILLLIGSRTRRHMAGLATTAPDRGTDETGWSTVSNHNVTS